MTTASEVIAGARQFLGVRFAHQGRSAAGLDCLGLLLVTAQACGIRLEEQPVTAHDVRNYGARPDTAFLQQRLMRFLRPVEVPQVGDVLLLKIAHSPQHLALVSDYPVAGELGMIHAYAVARKVVEHRYDAHWRAVTHGVYRLPSLA